MNGKRRRQPVRAGFSFLELQVAFVLLAIALAGLGPLVVMQSRQLRRLESRFNDQTTYYLVPSTQAWAAKLGAPASIDTEDPGPPAPPVTLVDNGGPGYSEIEEGTVDWTTLARSNALGGTLRHNDGSGIGDTAVWEFTGLEAGWYEVFVSYDAETGQATNAPYAVYDGAVCDGIVTVDQTLAPADALYQGVWWKRLGSFSIGGDTLRVELSDGADGNVVADAARLVPVRNDVEVLSLEKPLAGGEASAQVSVTVNTPQLP
jgi:hypothetical protein